MGRNVESICWAQLLGRLEWNCARYHSTSFERITRSPLQASKHFTSWFKTVKHRTKRPRQLVTCRLWYQSNLEGRLKYLSKQTEWNKSLESCWSMFFQMQVWCTLQEKIRHSGTIQFCLIFLKWSVCSLCKILLEKYLMMTQSAILAR